MLLMLGKQTDRRNVHINAACEEAATETGPVVAGPHASCMQSANAAERQPLEKVSTAAVAAATAGASLTAFRSNCICFIATCVFVVAAAAAATIAADCKSICK